PAQGGLPHLERRLVGQADGPAAPEEGELAAVRQPFGQGFRQGGPGVVGHAVGVQAQVGPEQGEGRGGEPGLHHGTFVGVVEDDQAVGGLPHRGGRVGGDGGGAGAPPQPAEQFQHFGGGAGPGEGDDPV